MNLKIKYNKRKIQYKNGHVSFIGYDGNFQLSGEIGDDFLYYNNNDLLTDTNKRSVISPHTKDVVIYTDTSDLLRSVLYSASGDIAILRIKNSLKKKITQVDKDVKKSFIKAPVLFDLNPSSLVDGHIAFIGYSPWGIQKTPFIFSLKQFRESSSFSGNMNSFQLRMLGYGRVSNIVLENNKLGFALMNPDPLSFAAVEKDSIEKGDSGGGWFHRDANEQPYLFAISSGSDLEVMKGALIYHHIP